jgi:hypothetical protein
MGNKKSVVQQCIDCGFIRYQHVRLLHLEVVKKVPHATGAIQRATDYVVKAEPRLAVIDDLLKARRQRRDL